MAKSISIDRLGETLTKVLGKLDEETLKSSEKAVRATFIETTEEIKVRTPVDTGRARANWFVTKNRTTDKTVKRTKDNPSQNVGKFSGDIWGNTFYISNNLPYIGVLEYGGYPKSVKKGSYNRKRKKYQIRSSNGFSKQAPSGMVGISLMKFDSRLKANLKRYKKR